MDSSLINPEQAYPIGFDDGNRIPYYNARKLRSRADRKAARNALEVVRQEEKLLKMIQDDAWIAYIYEQSRSCEDIRARVNWAKVVAEVARLGKREPAETSQATAVVNVQMDEPTARNILRILSQNTQAAGEQPKDMILEPPLDPVAERKRRILEATARGADGPDEESKE